MSTLDMSEEAPIIVAGHSHVNAIIGDVPPDEPALHPATSFPGVLGLYGAWPRGAAYWQKLQDSAAGARIALVWRGNEHNECFFFQTNQPFDFVSGDINQIMTTLRIVPQGMVREKFRPSMDDLVTLIAELNKVHPARLVLVGTPPPKADNEVLRQRLQTEPYFVQWANFMGRTLEDVKITPPRIRLKLWYLLQAMLSEAAKRSGAAFIPVPDQAKDKDGFLHSKYCRDDVTHANDEYGRLMMQQIMKELG